MKYKLKQKELMDRLEKEAENSSTIVKMLPDYSKDEQVCLTTVSFVSEIAERIKNEIIVSLKEVDSSPYYYPQESLHLTIQPIRVINNPPTFSMEDVEKVKKAFSIIEEFPSMNFSLEGLLRLPTSLAIRAYTDEKLKRLVLVLEKTLKEIGVPNDKTYISSEVFWGSITICRYTKVPSKAFINAAKRLKNTKLGQIKIRSVDLITTNSVSLPSKTKVIETYLLKD